MSLQNGCLLRRGEKSTEDIFSLLSKNSKDIHNSLFDYISTVAKELGESQCFNTIDLAEVLWRVELWRKEMPHIRPFYAVKTNSDPVLLRLFVLLGFSFDCASEGEIRYVLKAGGDTKNIIFAHTIKTQAAIRYAASVGVEMMTFDTKEELLKIHKYHPKARLLLRIVPSEVECSFDLKDKFGCEVEEAEDILSFAQTLGSDIVGISFHVGGLCKSPNSYVATIRECRYLFDTAKNHGFHFKILDIGGGFLGEKGSEGFFHTVSEAVQSALKEHFPDSGIEMIAEPGTYFVGSAVTLTTAVCAKKKRNFNRESDSIQRFYYVNDSIYGSFFKDVEHYGFSVKPLLNAEEIQRRPVYKSKIWGQTCCSEDLLMNEVPLTELEEGESIVWENMGAYSRVLCSNFCGMPFPASKYVFINNTRSNLEWLDKELLDYISAACSLIAKE